MYKRCTAFTFMCISLIYGICGIMSGCGREARIDVQERNKDIGVVLEGQTTRVEFEFENVGLAPLEVAVAGLSCSCGEIIHLDSTVRPGAKGTLTLEYVDSKRGHGLYRKKLKAFLRTNDPSVSTLELSFDAVIVKEFETEPSGRLSVGEVPFDVPIKGVFELKRYVDSTHDSPFGIRTSTPDLEAHAKLIGEKEVQRGAARIQFYSVEWAFRDASRLNVLSERVFIESPALDAPLVVTIDAFLAGPVTVTPKTLHWGVVYAGTMQQTTNAEVRLSGHLLESPLMIASAPPFLEASLCHVDKGTWKVSADLKQALIKEAGSLCGTIILRTADGTGIDILLPAKACVVEDGPS